MRVNGEVRMTGILDKFHVEHGIQRGARAGANAAADRSLPRDDRDVDTAIQMLKDDLDACAREMKRLIEVNSRGALFEGWAADI